MKPIFVEFVKKDNDKKEVYGYASTPALDSQGEIVEKEAIIKALPGYLGEWDEKNQRHQYGNIREMHQPSAVGKTIQAKVDEKGLWIKGKIVDKDAWEKVKEGVYAGFSIGGRVIESVKNRIKTIRLSEISLVDRPANPEAVFSMVKFDKAGNMVDMQEEPIKEPPHMDLMIASHILNLATELRYILSMFEDTGRSTKELNSALDKLKAIASKVLTGEDKKKFDTILYGINFAELDTSTSLSINKAKLPFKNRKNMPTGQFAYIDSKGGKHLPIHDRAHVQAAMARFNQTQFESPEKKKTAARKILAAARRHGMEIDPKSAVARAAKLEEAYSIEKFVDTSWSPGYFEEARKANG